MRFFFRSITITRLYDFSEEPYEFMSEEGDRLSDSIMLMSDDEDSDIIILPDPEEERLL